MSAAQFRKLRCEAGLSAFDAAYLLNVSLRAVRRWESRTSTNEAPTLAITLLKAAASGKLPEGWTDWRGHGVIKDGWKPVRFRGETGVAAGALARRELGADALARLERNKSVEHTNSV